MPHDHALPYWFAEVRDDRYRCADGPVLELAFDDHTLRIDSTDAGWLAVLDDEQAELRSTVELGEWLLAAARRIAPLPADGTPPEPADVEVITGLERGMASDLLFWMTDRQITPCINDIWYEQIIDGAPGTTDDSVSLGGAAWELPDDGSSPAASYGTVGLYRVGSRVFQDDGDMGVMPQGFWGGEGDEDRYIRALEQELRMAGLVVNPDDM